MYNVFEDTVYIGRLPIVNYDWDLISSKKDATGQYDGVITGSFY